MTKKTLHERQRNSPFLARRVCSSSRHWLPWRDIWRRAREEASSWPRSRGRAEKVWSEAGAKGVEQNIPGGEHALVAGTQAGRQKKKAEKTSGGLPRHVQLSEHKHHLAADVPITNDPNKQTQTKSDQVHRRPPAG